MFKLASLASLALAVGSVACTLGEHRREVVYYEAPAALQAVQCDSPFAEVDTSSLKECGSPERGKGHCFDPKKVGMADAKEYQDAACESGEACVADKVLAANNTKLKTCTFSVGGKAGTERQGSCSSMLSERIFANKDQLAQDVCDDDERCAPCIDPTTDNDTHVCDEQGAHEEACTFSEGAKAPEMCCHNQGTCIGKDAVPADQRGSLGPQSCDDGQICAPSAMVNGKPKKCDGPLGVKGVCLDYCFAEMLQGVKAIGQGTCASIEVCLPCVIGKSQGMPGCE